MTGAGRRFGPDDVVVGDWVWGVGAWWPHPVLRVNRQSVTVGIHRDAGGWLTTQSLPWADLCGVIPAEVDYDRELQALLSTAAGRLRRGFLSAEHRDALAALLLNAGTSMLPTPVTAVLHHALITLTSPPRLSGVDHD